MDTCIALFRGINVGGNRQLPMAELRTMLEKHGCAEVRTYIQSGNAIFCRKAADHAELAKRIGAAIAKSRGFEPKVLVLTRSELEKAAAANPFPQASAKPKDLHLFFLADAPTKPDLKALAALKAPTEQFVLKGKVFYLYTPDGLGKSKLAEKAERLLGVDATARNWRTVTTLVEMAQASS